MFDRVEQIMSEVTHEVAVKGMGAAHTGGHAAASGA
jgi:hypothetical protein